MVLIFNIHTNKQTTHICFVPLGGELHLADKSQGTVAVVLPLPQHSGIRGMGNRGQVLWCYWSHWGGKTISGVWGCAFYVYITFTLKKRLSVDFDKVSVIHLPLWLSSAESVRLYWPRGFTATRVQLSSQWSTRHSFFGFSDRLKVNVLQRKYNRCKINGDL